MRVSARRRLPMPWAEPMVDDDVEQRHARRRRRLPLVRAGRSLHQTGATHVQGPRAPGGGDRRSDDVGDGRPAHRSFQCRRGDRSRWPQGELRPRAEPLAARAGPRGGVGPRRPPRGDGRLRDRRAGHLPGHHRPGRPRPRPDRGHLRCVVWPSRSTTTAWPRSSRLRTTVSSRCPSCRLGTSTSASRRPSAWRPSGCAA